MENYFRDALNHFIFEEAGGGAIRHLANRGYTAKQITESLSFPLPYEKVREAYTGHLLENGILLREKPGTGMAREKTEYVREYDKYGKPSFRRVVVEVPERTDVKRKWAEMDFEEFLLLYKSGTRGGSTGRIELAAETDLMEAEKNIYISCSFGPDQAEEVSKVLETAQREYIQGICFTRKPMYHLLDQRMFGIAVKLRENGLAVGKVYVGH